MDFGPTFLREKRCWQPREDNVAQVITTVTIRIIMGSLPRIAQAIPGRNITSEEAPTCTGTLQVPLDLI